MRTTSVGVVIDITANVHSWAPSGVGSDNLHADGETARKTASDSFWNSAIDAFGKQRSVMFSKFL